MPEQKLEVLHDVTVPFDVRLAVLVKLAPTSQIMLNSSDPCCIVVVVVLLFYVQFMPGRSVNLTTFFLGRLIPPKRLTSTLCTYFRQ